MAKHARRVVQANGVDHIVTVIQGAVEEVVLPEEDWDNDLLSREEGDTEEQIDGGKKNQRVVDIILSGTCLLLCYINNIHACVCVYVFHVY